MTQQEILRLRRTVKDDEECPIYIWPKDHQVISLTPLIGEVAMIEVHVKPDGDINDRPSLVFVLETPTGPTLAAQISLDKLWPAIEAAIKAKGYES